MATKTNIFHQLSSLAIDELLNRGYLLNDLDWDVKEQKYTLRICGADGKSMVAVGLITFSLENNRIIVIDEVTHETSEFEIAQVNGQSNTDDFLSFICDWAQKLRDTAAYKVNHEINEAYNELLKQVSFYQIHPEYIPFVGDKYNEYRILHVGESHFIPQQKDKTDIFSIRYFEKWWTSDCSDLKSFSNADSGGSEWRDWLKTQSVIEDYLAGYRTKSHGIFSEMVKVFSHVCKAQTIQRITTEASQNYRHFAFMNFFQMPAIYKGEKFWYSLVNSACRLGLSRKDAKQYAGEIWDKAAEESSKVFDQVVDILEPNVIIFTSVSAWGAYQGKYKNATNIIVTVHPGCSYWNVPKEWQVGKEQLIEIWTEMYKNK